LKEDEIIAIMGNDETTLKDYEIIIEDYSIYYAHNDYRNLAYIKSIVYTGETVTYD
jgi:hypothetical protein